MQLLSMQMEFPNEVSCSAVKTVTSFFASDLKITSGIFYALHNYDSVPRLPKATTKFYLKHVSTCTNMPKFFLMSSGTCYNKWCYNLAWIKSPVSKTGTFMPMGMACLG